MFDINKLLHVVKLNKGGYSISHKRGHFLVDYQYDEKQPAQDLTDLHNAKYYYLKAARLQDALKERVCESVAGSDTVVYIMDEHDSYSCMAELTDNLEATKLYDSPSIEVNG